MECRWRATGGDILVTSSGLGSGGPSSVIRVDPVSGSQTTVSTGGDFDDPRGIAVEADGDILVADLADGVIRVDPVTGAQTTVSSGGSFVTPYGVTLEADGDILVADLSAFNGVGAVFRVDPFSGVQTTVATGGSMRGPNGIAVVKRAAGGQR